MVDEVNNDQTKPQPVLKPYTLENLQRRKEKDEKRVKELMELPDVKTLDNLPLPEIERNKFKLRYVRRLIARERATERQKMKAGTDPLTGIPNRRSYEQQLSYELARSVRDRKSFALIYFDIDHFKIFNDTFGHDVGDKVLIEIGKALNKREKINGDEERPVLRPIDTAARIGGEEFAIILPEIGEHDAEIQAKRIKQIIDLVASHIPELVEGNAHVTTSFGISIFEPHTKYDPKAKSEESMTQAFKRLNKEADTAMYDAKQNGRNKTVMYLPGMQERPKTKAK